MLCEKLKRLIVLICLLASHGYAQDTPGNTFFSPYPESGTWFAMDDSNTGFFMTVQNGNLAGAYFGFDGNGENVWLLFNGMLEPVFSTETIPLQTGWQLQTSLRQASNGDCILNCTNINNQPHSSLNTGFIDLKFTGRSSVNIRIDDNPPITLVPFTFGVSAPTVSLTTFSIIEGASRSIISAPDLEGVWAVAMGSATVGTNGNVLEPDMAESAGIVKIGPPQQFTRVPPDLPPDANLDFQSESPILSDTTGIFNQDSTLECIIILVSSGLESSCDIFNFNNDLFPQQTPGSISTTLQLVSDSRFILHIQTTDPQPFGMQVIRLEFFRLGYD